MDEVIDKGGKCCKCCLGTGVQYNKKTGLRIPCPYCNGEGRTVKKSRWKTKS